MDRSQAPPIVNLYVDLHKLTDILPVFANDIFFCVRFINDALAIWKHDRDPVINTMNLNEFKKAINKSDLSWTFIDPSTHVDVMGLRINIEKERITTNLFEHPLALHLYIPPHSCHPLSCFDRFVRCMILHFLQTVYLTKGHQILAEEMIRPYLRQRPPT